MNNARAAVSSTISAGVKCLRISSRSASVTPPGSPRKASAHRMAALWRGASADVSQPSSIMATRSSVNPACLATAKRTFRQ